MHIRNASTRPPNPETNRTEIEPLLAKGKRRLAATRTTTLQRRLQGFADLAPLNDKDLQLAISALNPDPADQDVLPSTSSDPSTRPLQITPTQLLKKISNPKIDSASSPPG